jgi:hypothetical protein
MLCVTCGPAKGTPATGFNAPVDTSMLNAEIEEENPFAVYRYLPEGSMWTV